MCVKSFLNVLFVLFLFSTGSVFSLHSEAKTKEQVLAEFIGAEGDVAELDELFDSDVTLRNHYLFWETKYGSRSLDIEQLAEYFYFYQREYLKQTCPEKFNPGGDKPIEYYLSGKFVHRMERLWDLHALLYPDVGGHSRLDSTMNGQLAMYKLCEFAYHSFLVMPYDPAGIGGLNRNFSDIPEGRMTELCQRVAYTVAKANYDDDLLLEKTVLNPDVDDFLCR